jgi:hypothetical protein
LLSALCLLTCSPLPRPRQGSEKSSAACHPERSEGSKAFVSSQARDAALTLSMTRSVFQHPASPHPRSMPHFFTFRKSLS